MFDKRKDSRQDGPKAHFDAGPNDLTGNKPAQGSGRGAVIGPQIRIKGDVTGGENLLIEGRIEGNIRLGEHRVDVGQTGQVHADIEAKEVKVDGEVRGDITGLEKVTISRTGRVQGNIKAPRMTLEDGAKFKGSIDMDPGEPARPAAKAAIESRPQAKGANGNGQGGPLPDKTKAEPALNLESK